MTSPIHGRRIDAKAGWRSRLRRLIGTTPIRSQPYKGMPFIRRRDQVGSSPAAACPQRSRSSWLAGSVCTCCRCGASRMSAPPNPPPTRPAFGPRPAKQCLAPSRRDIPSSIPPASVSCSRGLTSADRSSSRSGSRPSTTTAPAPTFPTSRTRRPVGRADHPLRPREDPRNSATPGGLPGPTPRRGTAGRTRLQCRPHPVLARAPRR